MTVLFYCFHHNRHIFNRADDMKIDLCEFQNNQISMISIPHQPPSKYKTTNSKKNGSKEIQTYAVLNHIKILLSAPYSSCQLF